MAIFQKSVIKKHLNGLDKEQVEKAFHKFKENYSPAKIEKIKLLKEEEYQDGFLRDLFVDVFGYILKPDDNFNLVREFKNQEDGKKADGAILKNEKAVAVIELKSTKTKDLKSITEQAFNYKNNQPDCKYVITSNFQKLRFYIDYANEYEEFDLFNLQKTDFDRLYLILNSNSIFSDLPLKLKEETKFHEQNISDKLYKDYSLFKGKLFENLIKNNPEKDKLLLFNKSQKLLDRFLFILFAEDSGLLPPNSISRIIETYHKLTELDAYKPIYEIYKQYFGYMNIGRKGKTDIDNIPAYNGGLFYVDYLLDNLKIDDEILIDDLLKLSEYDFNTEVDVNILGHIFEHSLSEIEEITAEIEGTATDKTKSKRKKDGVFYTPKYITQYIVENTIGTLCTEKRKILEILEIEFDGTYRTKDGSLSIKGKKLYQKLNDYKEWLLSLKIVDPACGSGAFLNQALNFLIREHKNIDDIIAELTNTALRLFDTEKSILENNLFGVDINEESVEIAKLSLWLRTARKDRKLSNLNNNIKCGNSLIDDAEVAGDKAFHWQTEFPQIFTGKKKKAWHITTATHNSRYSQRMFDYKVNIGEAVWMEEADEIIVTKTIAEIVNDDELNVIEYNICGDHLHLLLVCEAEELPKIVGKIKAVSSRKYNIEKGITIVPATSITRGHVPLSDTDTDIDSDADSEEKKEKKKYNSLWTQKFGKSEIKDESYLNNAIEYIRNNRVKHELPKSKEIEKIKKEFLCTVEHAFRTEYNGGFDVVIGNPPYTYRNAISDKEREYYKTNFKSIEGNFDLYKLFIEQIINISKDNSYSSFIIPNTFLTAKTYKKLRALLLDNFTIIELFDLGLDIFENVVVESIVFQFQKKKTTIQKTEIKIQRDRKRFFTDFENNYHIDLLKYSGSDLLFNTNISTKISPIIDKLFANFIRLENICYCTVGINTGYIKSELTSGSKIDERYHKMLNGKDIGRNFVKWDNEWIMYDVNFVKSKGDRGRSLPPEDIFFKDKILVQRTRRGMKRKLVCYYDTDKYYNLNRLSNIVLTNEDYSLKFIYSILNSELLDFFFNNYFNEYEVKPLHLSKLPIKEATKQAQQPFIVKANQMLDLNKNLQQKKSKFINRLTDNFEIDKLSKKLDAFYNFDFKTLLSELKKKKVILSLLQQDEWEEYFNAYKTEINNLQSQISKTDKEIDQMVYELYELTDDEIRIVEESV